MQLERNEEGGGGFGVGRQPDSGLGHSDKQGFGNP